MSNTNGGCGGCGGCGGSCGSCGGCGGCGTNELILSPKEVELLMRFGEIPFYPVVRSLRTDTAVILDEALSGSEYADALKTLELRGLVSVDCRIPLSGCDYSGYGPEYDHGSAALTAAGQRITEQIEILGVEMK